MTRVQLGSGGMASVTLEVSGVQGLIAVKRLHNHLFSHERSRALFEREAAIHAMVTAPNVCAFVGADLVERPQISLEYVRGLSLDRVSSRLQQMHEPSFFRAIARDAVDAVLAVHSCCDDTGAPAQIVHGDIAPDNLLVSFAGTSKLIDFGVATSRTTRALDGAERGRTPYLSPERLTGEPFDQRADQWSLAVLLYELLAGTHPFRRQSEPATFHAIAEEAIPAPSSVAASERRAWLAPLDAPILQALARDPSARHADVGAFSKLLFEHFGEAESDPGSLRDWLETNFSQEMAWFANAEKTAGRPSQQPR